MNRIRRLAASSLALLCLTAQAADPLRPLDAAAAAALGEVRVVVLVARLDFERAGQLETREYAKDFAPLIGEDVKLTRVQQIADGERSGAAGAVFLFASMGIGLVGGIADARHETTSLEGIARPVVADMEQRRQAAALDLGLARAVQDALRATGRVTVAGEPEAYEVARQTDLDDDDVVGDWLDANHRDDPRSVLVVALRTGVPRTLAAEYGIAYLWLSPARPVAVVSDTREPRRADYATHHADGSPRRKPLPGYGTAGARELLGFGRLASFASPVPPADLERPPPELVAARVAAIEAEFGERIEAQRDRDMRRSLRVGREAALEAAAKWTPRELAAHMRDAWSAPPGDVYPRVVTAAHETLARRIAQAVISDGG